MCFHTRVLGHENESERPSVKVWGHSWSNGCPQQCPSCGDSAIWGGVISAETSLCQPAVWMEGRGSLPKALKQKPISALLWTNNHFQRGQNVWSFEDRTICAGSRPSRDQGDYRSRTVTFFNINQLKSTSESIDCTKSWFKISSCKTDGCPPPTAPSVRSCTLTATRPPCSPPSPSSPSSRGSPSPWALRSDSYDISLSSLGCVSHATRWQ